MPDQTKWTRRAFLGKGAQAAAVFSIVPPHVLGGVLGSRKRKAPSETLTKAVIGVGGMGKGHIGQDMGGSICLAVCDVDANHLADGVAKAGNGCKGYRDFREVLTRDDIDVIHIATPPHWHALISIAAAQAGKDIWCEKPMTRFIAEGQQVINEVQRAGRMFRLNTWFRFQEYYGFGYSKLLRKAVANDLLGWPLTARVTMSAGFNWKVDMWKGLTNLAPTPIPPELDYDFWLGPSPEKPYHPHRVHQSFRGYWDYDGGGLSDMGQHYLDPVQYILGKDGTSPVTVEAYAPWPTHPDAVGMWGWVEMTYEDGCKIILESGEWGKPRDTGEMPFLEGPKGKLYKGFRPEPVDLLKAMDSLPDPEPMIDDFARSIRTRQKFGLNEMNGNRSVILVHLANCAIRTGRKLTFDPKTQRFVDDEEANRLANVPMRAPWTLPEGKVVA